VREPRAPARRATRRTHLPKRKPQLGGHYEAHPPRRRPGHRRLPDLRLQPRYPPLHHPDPHTPAACTAPAHALIDPALCWLTSPGGQAQVTFNQDVDTLASALVIENQATTVANHLIFEAAARTVRTQARTILANPALLPATHRAAYVTMLNDFITVANMLQPGARYGTTPLSDYTAWYTALRASNITVA
jgi:hypothetical protein